MCIRDRVKLVQSLDEDPESAGGAEKQLYDYVEGRLRAFNEPENRKWIRFSIEFWSTVQHDKFYKEMSARRYALYEAQIGKFIEDGIRTEAFRKDIEVERAAFVVISMIDGIAFLTAVMGQPLTDGRIQQTATMVVESFKKRG